MLNLHPLDLSLRGPQSMSLIPRCRSLKWVSELDSSEKQDITSYQNIESTSAKHNKTVHLLSKLLTCNS